MKNTPLGLALAILFIPTVIVATPNTIELKEFIAIAAKNHPRFARSELAIEQQKGALIAAKAGSDINAFAGFSSQTERPIQMTELVSDNDETTQTSYAGVRKSVWATGGTLTLQYGQTKLDRTVPPAFQPFAGPDVFYQNQAIIKYSQPLLQNLGGIQSRLPYNIAKTQLDVAQIQRDESNEMLALELSHEYLNWLFLKEQLHIANTRLELAKKAAIQTQKQHSKNLVDKVDVLRAEDAVQNAQQYVLLTKAQYTGKTEELAILLKEPKLSKMEPEYNLYVQAEPTGTPAEDCSRVLTILKLNRDIIVAQLNVEKNKYAGDLTLDLTAIQQSGDENYDESLEFDKYDNAVSLNYSRPLFNHENKGEIIRLSAILDEADLLFEEERLKLFSQLKNLDVQLTEMRKVLTLNQSQIDLSKKKTKEEQRYYNQGRSQLTFVIQAQDNEANAKLNYATNALNYQKLLMQYQALSDTLTDQLLGAN